MSSWAAQPPLTWAEPLEFAERYTGEDMAFLYSSLQEHFSGGVSYLFTQPIKTFNGNAWSALPKLPAKADGLPLWVGYIGYGLREDGARGSESPITLPDVSLTRYAQLFRFNHYTKTIEHFVASEQSVSIVPPPLGGRLGGGRYEAQSLPPEAPPQPSPYRGGSASTVPISPNNITAITSNFTRAEYESVVAETIEQIHAGNFYQANITRKFYGEFDAAPDSWQLFNALCNASPAPYSAYIRMNGQAILSSSPECFLSVDAHGVITTRPIKGSARRSDDTVVDATIQQQLKTSSKNHAENLMIVDLMRNDLARVSTPQTVEVVEQSALYSYRTIHHLISTIRAQKLPQLSVYDAVHACFPAGSMTGAPKIAAMRWCAEKEKVERGLYSGAIGWFGSGNICDLSVVIRTLILDGNRFEFQVGGGIVADSTPADEWRETITKARGILAALGLNEDDLARL